MIRSSLRFVKSEQRRNYEVLKKLEQFEPVTGSIFGEDKNGHTYYKRKYRDHHKQCTEYLGKASDEKTLEFVQAQFRQAFLVLVRRNIEAIKRFLNEYTPITTQNIYRLLPPIYWEAGGEFYFDRQLEEIKAWAKVNYPRNPAPINNPNIACDGTVVRSKGECIWYNCLVAAGLPFRYDCPVKVIDDMGRERIRYVDFLILCCDKTRIGIEHLGLLQDPTYGNDFSAKLREFQRVGLVLGSTLFVTSDYGDSTIDGQSIQELVEYLTERFYRA